MKLVKDYMKKAVVYFSPEDDIFHAAKIMAENDISGAPVVDKEKVVGIVSESDIIRYIRFNVLMPKIRTTSLSLSIAELLKHELTFTKELKKLSKAKIKDIMSKKVISISPDKNILDAANLMSEKDIQRLPVIDSEGKLVGIISRTDLLRALLD